MKTKVKTKSTALSPRPDATKVASNTSDSHAHSSSQIVTCRLDSIEFGMDIESVQEIVRLPKITPVPKAPHYVRGLANLRGNVLPVIDPRLRFGMESAEDESNCRVVVLEIGGVPTGLIVDAVREVMTVDDAAVQPPPSAVQGVDSQFLRGVVKLDGGNRLVMLIDQDKIIDFDEIDLSTTVHDAATTSTSARGAEAEQSSEHDYEQLVSFRIGDEEYAFSIMDVKEIIRLPEITIVPDAPRAVEGITALRDRVVPVVNLRTKFGFPTLETQTDAIRSSNVSPIMSYRN